MPNAVGNAALSFKYAVHPITSARDGDDTFDVLTDHQHCNWKPKSPSADCLCHSAAHHRLWPREIVETDDEVDNNNIDDDNVEDDNDAGDDNIDNNNNIDDNVNDNDEVGDDKWGEDEMDDNDNLDNEADEDEEPPRKCVRGNSTRHNAKPTQLRFYLGIWADVLERAKQYFRLWLVNNCPFAECEANLPDAQCALKQAIDEFKAKDTEVEPGKWSELSAVIF